MIRSVGTIVFLAALSILPLDAAKSADVKYSGEFTHCMDRSGGVIVSMMEYYKADTAVWDARLNANYKRLMASLTPEQQKALRDAEVRWVKFREADCTLKTPLIFDSGIAVEHSGWTREDSRTLTASAEHWDSGGTPIAEAESRPALTILAPT